MAEEPRDTPAIAVQPVVPTELEISNELARKMILAAVHAITRGESDHGHTRLTVEIQHGSLRKAWVERTFGGSELVTA
jgi:hypothetical protein